MKKHIVLIGLPGAGKTTAGPLVAAELKTRFVDLDELIEQEQGLSVRDIFVQQGERAFREMEQAVAARVFEKEPLVMAPGGGWSAQPGAIERAQARGFIVYLRTSPELAAQRVGQGRTRPLLGGANPEERMRELLTAREGFYKRANVTVGTDERSAKEVAREITVLARSQAGW